MKVLITICARGGSKGIPGKNIKPLNGKQLILYTLETAEKLKKSLQEIDIQLSTDNDEIVQLVAEAGYPTSYRRPAILASDNAGKIDAIKDAWKYAKEYYAEEYDFVIDLDVTSPLRNVIDITSAIQQLKNNPDALNIFSVNPANRNPYFNMVELHDDGFVKLVKNNGQIKSRQQAPTVYDMNASFYIFTKRFMEGDFEISITEKSLAYVMDHVCFDLDHPMDFTMMEQLMKNNLLDFEI
jgi:CMP-N-acetylneuraminic acid synthetase